MLTVTRGQSQQPPAKMETRCNCAYYRVVVGVLRCVTCDKPARDMAPIEDKALEQGENKAGDTPASPPASVGVSWPPEARRGPGRPRGKHRR